MDVKVLSANVDNLTLGEATGNAKGEKNGESKTRARIIQKERDYTHPRNTKCLIVGCKCHDAMLLSFYIRIWKPTASSIPSLPLMVRHVW